jgi:hypothetical protein
MKTMVAFLVGLLGAGCAYTEYSGTNYQPTTRVDVYYGANQITKKYTVMGEAKTEGGQDMSFQQIEQKMVKDAMAKGADAILIEGMDDVTIGVLNSTTGKEGERPVYVVGADGTIQNVGGTAHYELINTSSTVKDMILKAQLLKYTE